MLTFKNQSVNLEKLRFEIRLALANDFRTLRWEVVFKYPEIALSQIKELVGRC